MPAEIVKIKCTKCHGTGFNPCEQCEGRGWVYIYVCKYCGGNENYNCSYCQGNSDPNCSSFKNANYNEIVDSCWRCSGKGNGPICSICEGTGYEKIRTWVPKTADETESIIRELEKAYKDSKNCWKIINMLRRGYRFTEQGERDLLFPKNIIKRIKYIEEHLPPACASCGGQGWVALTNSTCAVCQGMGHKKRD